MDRNVKISRSRRPLLAAAVVMTAATGLAVANAQPALASSHRPCKVVKHSNTAGVVKVGTGTATLGADGLKVATAPSKNDDKVSWRDNFRPVAANTVNELSYETVKLDQAGAGVNDAALPAYHIYVKTPAGEGTLVFEPYWYLGQIRSEERRVGKECRSRWS